MLLRRGRAHKCRFDATPRRWEVEARIAANEAPDVASHFLPQSPAVEKSLVALRLRSMEIQMLRSSDAAFPLRERLARDLVEMALAALAGKPLPKLRRKGRKGKTAAPRSKIVTDHDTLRQW